jgi:hypothetical protein
MPKGRRRLFISAHVGWLGDAEHGGVPSPKLFGIQAQVRHPVLVLVDVGGHLLISWSLRFDFGFPRMTMISPPVHCCQVKCNSRVASDVA